MTHAKTGFLASFDSARHADFVAEHLSHVTVAARRLQTFDPGDELVETRPGLPGITTGMSTGAAVGLGIGALAAVLIPGAGTAVLGGLLASMAGFGSAGATVGGLLGLMSGDEAVEETVRFVHDSIARGQAVIVVETDAASHHTAILLCQRAGAVIHEINEAESARFHKQAQELPREQAALA